MTIPTKKENPTGLHINYTLQKADGSPVSESAEYFVLRLDEGGDPFHVAACRQAILTYADEIQPWIPDLAHDIRKKYS